MTDQQQQFDSITKVLADLKATASRNEKSAILEANKDNEMLKMVIKAAIDPYSVFYITDIPDESYVPDSFEMPEGVEDISEDQLICSILSELNQNTSRSHIRGYFAILGKLLENNADGLELVRKILKGDLDCGIAASTVNGVWPDLINTFKVMKAEEKAHLGQMRYPALAGIKMDGVRAVAFYRDGNVEVRSSSGRVFQKIPSIENAIKVFAVDVGNMLYDGFVLDGEIVAVDENGNIPRQTSNGLANKALKGTISDEDEVRMVFYAFDVLSSATQLERGIDARPLERRIRPFMYIDDRSNLREVPSIVVENEAEAMQEFKDAVAAGEEGIVLKAMDSIYESKRSKEWIKLKKEFQCEVEIIDWKPHSKKEGMLGGMTVQTSDGNVVGDLGTKLSERQRKELFDMAQHGGLLGTIITIMFHDISSSKSKTTKSFYLPRFIEIRYDKDTADTLETIEAMM